MEIIKPEQKGFTVYSKSGCPNCMSVKHFIKDNKLFYTEINLQLRVTAPNLLTK